MKLLAPFLLLFVLLIGPAFGKDAGAVQEDVLLTVSRSADGQETVALEQFTRARLQDMPRVEFTTTSSWYEGEAHFAGVPLKTILQAAGITSGTIKAVALNDYAVEMPVADLEENAPIVAYLMNDAPMSPRGKGPLWIVYPYSADSKYRSEEVASRSVWQLDRLISQ